MIKYYLLTIGFAMIPIFELRGAIPAAVWGYHINPIVAYFIAVLGNMIPVPFIYLFARKVLEWGKDKKYIGKFFSFCLRKGEKAGDKLNAKSGKGRMDRNPRGVYSRYGL